jgi:hypothetical protein
MQELNRLDRPVERPTYSNEKAAELHHNGQVSRSEAEVLDIIYTSFAQRKEDDTVLTETRDAEEQWEPSSVAIVHEGVVIPIINLEEVILWSGTPAEKWVICRQVANILYDVLLTLLTNEGGGKAQ